MTMTKEVLTFVEAIVKDRSKKAHELADNSKSTATQHAKRYEILLCDSALAAIDTARLNEVDRTAKEAGIPAPDMARMK